MTKSLSEQDQLSEGIQNLAYISKGGEFAWKKQDITRLIKELVDLRIAILGGEVWIVDGESIHGFLPLKTGENAVFHWSTERNGNEDWKKFVKRSLFESMNTVNNLHPEDEVKEEFADKLYYNVTLCNETSYNLLK